MFGEFDDSGAPVSAGAAAGAAAGPPGLEVTASGRLSEDVGAATAHGRATGVQPATMITVEIPDQWLGVRLRRDMMMGQPAPGSPAERAGIRSGDVLVQVHGQPVDSIWPVDGDHLNGVLAALRHGKRPIKLVLSRCPLPAPAVEPEYHAGSEHDGRDTRATTRSPAHPHFKGGSSTSSVRALVDFQWVKWLAPVFVLLSLLNRIFLTVQYSYTTYPGFVNVYWQLFAAAVYRIIWIIVSRRDPSLRPLESPPWWFFWFTALLGSLDNVLLTVAISRLTGYGALQVLIGQSKIPFSLLFSRLLMRHSFKPLQYVGAVVVVAGICTTLSPDFAQSTLAAHLLPWAGLLLLGCVVVAFLGVINEKMMIRHDWSEYYMMGCNQHQSLIMAAILYVPAVFLSGEATSFADVGSAFIRGAQCQFGTTPPGDAPNSCMMAPVFTHAYIFVNIVWNLTGVAAVKRLPGGASTQVLLGTLVVPLATCVFSIPGMPSYQPTSWATGAGLALVVAGVVLYRHHVGVAKLTLNRGSAARRQCAHLCMSAAACCHEEFAVQVPVATGDSGEAVGRPLLESHGSIDHETIADER